MVGGECFKEIKVIRVVKDFKVFKVVRSLGRQSYFTVKR